jgi:hypothetical protein
MDKKLEMSNFQPNLNRSKTLFVTSYMVLRVHRGLVCHVCSDQSNLTRISCSNWIPNAIRIYTSYV